MTTAAIRALGRELEKAKGELAETKAATADAITKGETAKARLASAQREVDELSAAMASLEKIEGDLGGNF